MANATFGVNIIPKDNANVTIGNSDHPWTVVSPNMTGTPTAPTATGGTDTTQVATTEFVQNEFHTIVAEEYDETKTYTLDQYCIHDGMLYRCNVASKSAGAWNSYYWTQITIDGELTGALTDVGYDSTYKRLYKDYHNTRFGIVYLDTIKSDLSPFTWGQIANQSDQTQGDE